MQALKVLTGPRRPDKIGPILSISLTSESELVRVFNFAAGPATLPLEVLEQARSELTDWRGSGMSVMEVSHRSKAFIAVATEAEADLRQLLAIPQEYKVLFLQGIRSSTT